MIIDFEQAYKDLLQENERLKRVNLELTNQLDLLQEEYKKLESLYVVAKERSDKFMPLKRQISDEQVDEIKKLRLEGKTFKQIREITGWSNVTISRVLKGVYDI